MKFNVPVSGPLRPFALYARTKESLNEIDKHFFGNITLQLEESATSALPERFRTQKQSSSVDVERFYESLPDIGLDYRDSFGSIVSINRRIDVAERKPQETITSYATANCSYILNSWIPASKVTLLHSQHLVMEHLARFTCLPQFRRP